MRARINLRSVIYALLTFPFFPPAYYIFPVTVSKAIRLVACVLIFVLYLCKVGKVSKSVAVILAFFTYTMIVSTLMNYQRADIKKAVELYGSSIGFILLLEMGLTIDRKAGITGMLIGSGIPCIISLITFFIYAPSHGMVAGQLVNVAGEISGQAWYWLTHANASFFIMFPVLILLYAERLRSGKKIWPANIMAVISLVGFIVADSTTSYIVLVAFVFYVLLLWDPGRLAFIRKRVSKLFEKVNNTWAIILIIVAGVILIVFLNITNYFTGVLAALGKSSDLTKRIPIWNKVIQSLRDDPFRLIIGFGWEDSLITIEKIGINHCHNILLELVYRGGMIGLLLFTLFTASCLRKLNQSRIGRLLGFGLITMLICSIMDFYVYRYEMYIIYLLIDHMDSSGFGEIKLQGLVTGT